MSGGMLPRTKRKHSFCRRVSPSCARHCNRGAAHHDKNLAGAGAHLATAKNAMSTHLRSLVGGAAGSRCSQIFPCVRPWCICGLEYTTPRPYEHKLGCIKWIKLSVPSVGAGATCGAQTLCWCDLRFRFTQCAVLSGDCCFTHPCHLNFAFFKAKR